MDALQELIKPKERQLIVDRLKLLGLKQPPDESINNFLLRINFQASFCHLNRLKEKPEEEIMKLIFIVELLSAKIKLKVLDKILGMTNFYRRFVLVYTEKVEPLSLARSKKFKWSKERDKVFLVLITHIYEAPVFQPYSMEKMSTLIVDASLLPG